MRHLWEQQILPFVKKLQIFDVPLPGLFQPLPHLLSNEACSSLVLIANFIDISRIIIKIFTILITLIIKPF